MRFGFGGRRWLDRRTVRTCCFRIVNRGRGAPILGVPLRVRHLGSAKLPVMKTGRAILLAAMALVAACSSSSSGGTKLPLGTEAVIASYTEQANGTTPAVDTSLGVTVLAVREGTQAELAAGGFTFDDDSAKTATPYYVDARYENKGKGEMQRTLSVGMEDTKGNSIPTTIVLDLGDTPFAQCADNNDPAKNLEPGDSYETCTLFLVPKGAKLDRVRFVSQAADATINFTDWATK
jgi:hypothetical protein